MQHYKSSKVESINSEQLVNKIRNSALGSITMREHSVGELEAKLRKKFDSTVESFAVEFDSYDPVSEIVEWLVGLDYLNDKRFAEMFVRASVNKGRGPIRIRQELQRKLLPRQLICDALGEACVDWFALAEDVWNRKFSEKAVDQKNKAKQIRFLQSRGFEADHVFSVL